MFYGYAVAECLWAYDGSRIVLDDIKVSDRSRFKFDLEGNLRLININHPSGMKLPEKKFWVFSAGADHSDNPYGIWHRYPATSSVPPPVIGQSMGGVRE